MTFLKFRGTSRVWKTAGVKQSFKKISPRRDNVCFINTRLSSAPAESVLFILSFFIVRLYRANFAYYFHEVTRTARYGRSHTSTLLTWVLCNAVVLHTLFFAGAVYLNVTLEKRISSLGRAWLTLCALNKSFIVYGVCCFFIYLYIYNKTVNLPTRYKRTTTALFRLNDFIFRF